MGSAEDRNELAFALSGGGARGAYQLGFLRHLARRYPDLCVPILTGVSAGAINAAHLANHRGRFANKVEQLTKLWCGLSVDQVFRVDARSLLGHLSRWAAQLTLLGGRRGVRQVRGLVDTSPLYRFLCRALECEDGSLPLVAENLQRGDLRALAITTTSYATGQTVTFCQGRQIEPWQRPSRISVPTELRLEHVMASASLPLFFPAVQIGESWYGDGGIRLHSPLAPAVHLGARRIVAISTRHRPSPGAPASELVSGYPPPAQVLGVLLNAVFLDLLDQDAMQLERINGLLEGPEGRAQGSNLRRIDLLVLRPSQDLGSLAHDYEPRLPGTFRFLMRRLGTRETSSQDLISMVMFQADYINRLIDMGEADADARADEIAAIIEAAG